MENTGTDLCAICLSNVGLRHGHAIFTAECSHNFHLRCIYDSVAHGNCDCPLRKATWRDVPAVSPVPASPQPRHPRLYADDDPVAESGVHAQSAGQASIFGVMVLKTHCERPAIARDASRDGFAVLVHARAPGRKAVAVGAEGPRAPLDLVTVLDVSGSMHGSKLNLLKQAMGFVIDKLSSADRLNVVSFSAMGMARRLS